MKFMGMVYVIKDELIRRFLVKSKRIKLSLGSYLLITKYAIAKRFQHLLTLEIDIVERGLNIYSCTLPPLCCLMHCFIEGNLKRADLK